MILGRDGKQCRRSFSRCAIQCNGFTAFAAAIPYTRSERKAAQRKRMDCRQEPFNPWQSDEERRFGDAQRVTVAQAFRARMITPIVRVAEPRLE